MALKKKGKSPRTAKIRSHKKTALKPHIRIVPAKGIVDPLTFVAPPRMKIRVRTYGRPVVVWIEAQQSDPPQTIPVDSDGILTAPGMEGVYNLKIEIPQPGSPHAEKLQGVASSSQVPMTGAMASPIVIVEP